MNGPPPDDLASDSDITTDGGDRGPDRAAGHVSGDTRRSGAGGTGDVDPSHETNGSFEDPVGDLLPRAGVDSRWWYWIAAIPLYVVVGVAAVLLFAVVALLGFGIGFDAGFVVTGLLFAAVFMLGDVGIVLSIVFPIAMYIDTRAIAASEASWTPDPLVWGLAALATEVLSAFTLSVVVALYYLYKRHVAVGTP
jgi:hypothetical protein